MNLIILPCQMIGYYIMQVNLRLKSNVETHGKQSTQLRREQDNQMWVGQNHQFFTFLFLHCPPVRAPNVYVIRLPPFTFTVFTIYI